MAVKTVNFDDYKPEQVNAAEMLADLDSTLTAKQVAAEIGISEYTLSRWRHDERFLELLEYITESNMRFFLHNVYKQLHKTAKTGNTRALEMLLKQQGKLIERRETTTETTVTVTADKSATQLQSEIAELERRLMERAADTIELTADADGVYVGGSANGDNDDV